VSEEDTTKDLKVTDRRMFTPDGELRVAEQVTTNASAEGAADVTGEPEQEFSPGGEQPVTPSQSPESAQFGFAGPLPEPGFADLVSILAEPIALFLGDVPLPDGSSAENLDLARFHIDLLGVLKGKTESNLSPEESAVLDDLLYRLRMRYVQKSE
jgi:hypothetical protein